MERIEFDSDEAAKHVTGLEGWVDRHGRFWGNDERMARWSGCTHQPCEDCKASTPKGWIRCEDCREKKAVERYESLEKKIWDGQSPLYSEAHDQWFFDDESLWEYLDEHECSVESLRLVTAKPQYLREIDVDYFVDDLPEDDHDLPDDVQSAMDALNEVIRKQHPVSFIPDKFAALVDQPID